MKTKSHEIYLRINLDSALPLMNSFRLLLALMVLLMGNRSFALDVAVFDLRNDWSTNSNPNGVWTYRAGSEILPAYSWGDSFPYFQPSWQNNSPGSVPAWIFSTTNPVSGCDWQQGDVVVHTQDNNFGSGNGQANVLWTSPFTGTIRISGGVWMGRDIGRANNWYLYLNGNLLSGGSTYSGDPYSRANPFFFTLGSGGSNVLQNVQVTTGDQIMLEIDRTGTYGDYVGVNLTITETVPDPNLSVRVSEVEVCADTATNAWYQFQYTTNLTSGLWLPLTTNFVQGTGARYCIEDAIIPDSPQKMYRVAVTNAAPF